MIRSTCARASRPKIAPLVMTYAFIAPTGEFGRRVLLVAQGAAGHGEKDVAQGGAVVGEGRELAPRRADHLQQRRQRAMRLVHADEGGFAPPRDAGGAG